MIQEFFHLGPLSVSPFGVFLALAFLASYWQLQSLLKQQGLGDQEDASEILIWAGVGGVLGAKMYYAVLYGDWSLLFARSGLVWYGGFLLATLTVVFAIRRRGLPMSRSLDAAAVSLALGYGVGRVGCFLVGDDYGLPTSLPWGVEFPVGLPPTTAGALRSTFALDIPAEVGADQLMRVHPTQLYETVAAVLIWQAGRRLLRGRTPAGAVIAAITGLLAIERFGIEFLRAKDDRFFGMFTLAQMISLGVLVAAIWVWSARTSAGARAADRGT